MSYPIAEVLGRVERRRRFSVEQKVAVLAEATAPGANMSEVARRHGLLPAQVCKWRRLAELGIIGMPGASELPSFVAVEITKDVRSLAASVPEGEPAAISDAPRRRWRNVTFTRLPPSQWKSARTTNAIERLHEELKRRIKTQTVLPSAETAAMLFWALLASGQITMRKVDGWHSLTQETRRYAD